MSTGLYSCTAILLAALLAVGLVRGRATAGEQSFVLDRNGTDVPVLVVAENRVGEQKPALLIGLHGFGIDERQMATLVNVRPDGPYIYVAPRGFHELDDKSRGWFDVSVRDGRPLFEPEHLEQAADDVVAFVPSLVERYDADASKVAIVGYSQGAVVSLAIALRHPSRIAAAAVLSGAPLDRIEFTDKIGKETDEENTRAAIFIGHGTLDGFTETAAMRAESDRLARLGYDVTDREYEISHVVSKAERIDIGKWLSRRFASVRAKDDGVRIGPAIEVDESCRPQSATTEEESE